MTARENMLIDFITEIANDRYDCVDPAKKDKAQKLLAAFDLEQDAAGYRADKDLVTAKTAALTQACEITFTYLTNVNTAEPEQVIEALVAALVLCGRDEAELRECAKAAFDGAAGAF